MYKKFSIKKLKKSFNFSKNKRKIKDPVQRRPTSSRTPTRKFFSSLSLPMGGCTLKGKSDNVVIFFFFMWQYGIEFWFVWERSKKISNLYQN